MPMIELYSQRRRRELGASDDVLQYSTLPKKLRMQITFIIQDAFGSFSNAYEQKWYTKFVSVLTREFGFDYLSGSSSRVPGTQLKEFIQGNSSDEQALDAVELVFRTMSNLLARSDTPTQEKNKYKDALEEFNYRCKAAGFGYAFEKGELTRIDSQFLHAEAVKPALVVLSELKFKNADAEFRSAHEHWRHGNNSDVLVSCLKAFESTMKIIASDKGWAVPDKATAKQLIEVMFANKLVPAFYQTQFAGLRSVLESGIPTARNRAGGHGAGTATEAPAPNELVKYVLHLTAATILYLVDAYKNLP